VVLQGAAMKPISFDLNRLRAIARSDRARFTAKRERICRR
jgi:hypothetical protein